MYVSKSQISTFYSLITHHLWTSWGRWGASRRRPSSAQCSCPRPPEQDFEIINVTMSVHSPKRIIRRMYVTQAPDVRNYLVTYKYPSYDSVSPCLRHDLTSLTGTLMTLVSRRSLQSPRPRRAIGADIWTQFRCPGPGHRSHQVMCRARLRHTSRETRHSCHDM